MEIVYKHKETGYKITHKEIKERINRAENCAEMRMYLDCTLRLYTRHYADLHPIEYIYDMRNIPFSDEFEVLVEGVFKKDELNNLLGIIDYIGRQSTLYNVYSETREKLQTMLIEEYYKK